MHIDSKNIKAGTKVRIKSCSAWIHDDNKGCLCKLIGKIVVISRREWRESDGPPTYNLVGYKQRVTRKEVAILKNQK